MSADHDFSDLEDLTRLVRGRSMVNKQLQDILAIEGESKAGVKATLQTRIINRLREYVRLRDTAAYKQLRTEIHRNCNIRPFASSIAPHKASPAGTNTPKPANFPTNLSGPLTGMGGGSPTPRTMADARYPFRASPFYAFVEQIGVTRNCDAMAQHRHTITVPIRPSAIPSHQRIVADIGLRIMMFCRVDGYGVQHDIAFPHQCDIKVNGAEIKANLRGLKNKPGSTRPVDLTKDLRMSPVNYNNQVEFTYALTNKRFALSVFVMRVYPVEDLVKKITDGRRITKDSVIREMLSRARDADIVATSSALSLKCPLSTLRMDLPCRSTACPHNQCFDATSYLQLQEQGPTWLCPLCNKPAPFETLVVDEYVQDILKNTPKSADQVIVEPDGVWKLPQTAGDKKGVSDDEAEDDEDLVVVDKPGGSARTTTPNSVPPIANGTSAPQTALSIKKPGTSANVNGNGKRPITQVIDLTSDDDEPVRPSPKRHSSSFRLPPIASLPQSSHLDNLNGSQNNRLPPYGGGVFGNGHGNGTPRPV